MHGSLNEVVLEEACGYRSDHTGVRRE